MKKLRAFFIITALILITVTVFAGKSKFDTYDLYAYNSSGGYCRLTGTVSLFGLTLTGSTQATISNGSVTMSLYGYKAGVYYSLYLQCFF